MDPTGRELYILINIASNSRLATINHNNAPGACLLIKFEICFSYQKFTAMNN